MSTKIAIPREAGMKTLDKFLEKMTKTVIWSCVAKYIIPTFGILFIVVYFCVGFMFQYYTMRESGGPSTPPDTSTPPF